MRALVTIGASTIVVVASTAHAASWDPFPELPVKEPLAIAKTLDSPAWNSARSCLGKTFVSGATFTAAVVEVTDSGGSKSTSAANALPYVDALHRDWRAEGRLDAEKHVLFAIGTSNRSVAIHVGNRWTEIGFKTSVAKSTIDGSSFGKLALEGDYPAAVCALASAVDATLIALAGEESKTIARLRREIDDLRKRAAEVLPKFRALGLTGKWATEEQAKLEKIDDKLEAALKMFGEGKVGVASENVASSSEVLQFAEAAVDRVAKERASLAAAKVEIDKVLASIDRNPSHDFPAMKVARAKVDRCARDDEQGTAALRAYDPWVATPAPSVCLDLARPAVVQAEAQWRFRARTLPFAIGTFSVSALGLLIAMRRRKRSAIGLAAQERVETWETAVERSAARLLSLERDHAVYFSAARTRWVGESEPLDLRVAEAVNRAFLLQSTASDRMKRADAWIASAGPLSVAPLQRANDLLTSEPVELEAGEAEPNRRIDRPLQRAYEGSGSTVLGDLAHAYTEAFAALEAAGSAVARARTSAKEADHLATEALARVHERSELGLATEHLVRPLRALLELRGALRETMRADPVAAASKLAVLVADLRALVERAELGNETHAALASIAAREDDVRERAAALRAEGTRLDEPGLALDQRLERGRVRAGAVRDLLQRGEEPLARETLAITRGALEELEHDLERSTQGRDRTIAEATRLQAEIESRRGDARIARLPALEAAVRESLVDHEAQRYLSATRRLEEVSAILDRPATPVDADEVVANRVRAAFARSTAACEALSGATGVSTAVAESVSAALAELASLRAAIEGEAPDWPALDRRARALDEELEVLAGSLAEAKSAHGRHKARAAALDLRLRTLGHEVDVDPRERPHVRDAVAVARARVDALLASIERGEAHENEVALATETVDWAAEVCRLELSAIDLFERELAAARHRLRQVQGHDYGEGVVADAAIGKTELAAAEALRARKDWSGALVAAEAARAAAELEDRNCFDRARALRDARLTRLTRSPE